MQVIRLSLYHFSIGSTVPLQPLPVAELRILFAYLVLMLGFEP